MKYVSLSSGIMIETKNGYEAMVLDYSSIPFLKHSLGNGHVVVFVQSTGIEQGGHVCIFAFVGIDVDTCIDGDACLYPNVISHHINIWWILRDKDTMH